MKPSITYFGPPLSATGQDLFPTSPGSQEEAKAIRRVRAKLEAIAALTQGSGRVLRNLGSKPAINDNTHEAR